MFPRFTEVSMLPPVVFLSATGERRKMAYRASEIRYLREKARQFRELAQIYKGEVSSKLLEIAEELDARADALEKGFNSH